MWTRLEDWYDQQPRKIQLIVTGLLLALCILLIIVLLSDPFYFEFLRRSMDCGAPGCI